jgi:uncharacterized protein (TIGR03790 family)
MEVLYVMTNKLILLTITLSFLAAPCLGASNVLVVVNENSRVSSEIGSYYAAKRHIPKSNICRIRCSTSEYTTMEDFSWNISDPIWQHIKKHRLKGKIDYIVTTKGVPLAFKHSNGNYSVDSALTCIMMPFTVDRAPNPFFNSNRKFRSKDFNFFVMVTRLDGYTKEDAKRLVDNSLKAKPAKGLFVFDIDPKRDKPGYKEFNSMMKTGSSSLKKRGFKIFLEESEKMCPGKPEVMGFYTWGSNDHGYDHKRYVAHTFLPGAIAETLVSTSARTFGPVKKGQSVITDLIARGITGIKGYCSEPYTIALAQGHILFDRYTRGFNLAESFYAASPYIYWKDIVIGDPLCAPYARK